MESAEFANRFRAWSKHQMIGVAEDDLSSCFFELAHFDAFDGTARSHGHEGRKFDDSMRRCKRTASRLRLGVFIAESVFEKAHRKSALKSEGYEKARETLG